MKFDPPSGTVTAVLGPTNTGKTHYAIERMLARESGIIGLPLRLLAREVYDRIVALRGPGAVSLITGEEKISPPRARYHVCTVEAMPLGLPVDFVAVDEIQLCTDPDRGHVFTDRLLRARGRYETLLLGSDTMRGRIASLVPGVRHHGRTRFSKLSWTGPRKISRLRPRTAIVAFSVDQVYAIAELIRRQRGGAAVVMGALSPRTRNAQVALYQEGDVDYMVATDAIGMGLNMDVDHVAFAGTTKFDGRRHRALGPDELAQIAGRAGRYLHDGTFGTTGEAPALAPEVVEAIEAHRFRPAGRLMWRNHELRFHSVEALMASLDIGPGHPDLARAREAEDQAVLRALREEPGIRALADRGDRVRLLWDVCQIPDFRKVSPGEHATLVGRIYRFLLTDAACIPSDWLAGQIGRLDRIDGDIDALSRRLAFIRTWTYVANRAGWVEDARGWRDETRAVEDRLSDALHERLTQRFVDRRTSHLLRRLKQKERLVAEVNDKGEVSAEGHYLGRLTGFRFAPDETASGDELKTLRSASMSALGAEFSRRADKLYLSPDGEIDVTDQGGLMWGTDAIGRLSRGDDALAPKIEVFVDEMAGPEVAEKVERRLRHWLGRRVNALFEPLLAMRDDDGVTGLARGVAFRLVENFGIVARREIAGDVRALEQADRAALRRHGVRFGQHFVFMPALLKPAPTRLRVLLWSLAQGLDDFAEAPPPGHVTVPVERDMAETYYHMAGYRPAGGRALRIDMLERLADLIRPLDARAGFEATQDMLSITGLGPEQFAELMTGLGYQAEKRERPKPPKPARPARAEAVAEATAETATEPSADGAPAAAQPEAGAAPTPDPAPAGAETGDETRDGADVATPAQAGTAETAAETAAETGPEMPPETVAPAAAPATLDATGQGAGQDRAAPTGPAVPDLSDNTAASGIPAPAPDGGKSEVSGDSTGDAGKSAEQAGAEPATPATERDAVAPAEPPSAGPAESTGDGSGGSDGEAPGDVQAAGAAEPTGEGDATASAAAQTAAPAESANDGDAAASTVVQTDGPAESAGGDVPAGGGELESYFVFRIRPRARGPRRGPPRQASGEPTARAPRRGPRRGHAAPDGAQEASGAERGKSHAAEDRPAGGGARHHERPARAEGERPRGAGKGPKGKPKRERSDAKPRHYEARPPKNDRPVDPDSPFAVLQQLKNR